MYSFNCQKVFIFSLFFPAFILPIAISSPIPETPYGNFISYLIKNNCTMPKELKLPFVETTDPSPFSYLSTPLRECQTPDVSKENDEAHMLCTEVFDVLKNISCGKYISLPTIESGEFSKNVCPDFASIKYNFPQKENYLSGKLSDKLICKIFCTAEKYESLCKTLLWSYQTLMKIDIALSNKEKETGKTIKDSPPEVNLPVKSSPVSAVPETSSQSVENPEKPNINDNVQADGKNILGSNVDQTDQKPRNSGELKETPLQVADVSNEKKSPDVKIQNEATNKSTTITKTSAITKTITKTPQVKSESNNEKLSPKNVVKQSESENLPDINNQPDDIDDNEIDTDEKLPKDEANNDISQTNSVTKNLTSDKNGINENQKIKNVTVNDVSNKNDQEGANSQVGAKPSGKSEEKSVAPATGNDNELQNNNFPEEDNKSGVKQTDLENKEVEKPKETDYESSNENELLPDSDSKLPEPSTQSTIPDEDIEHPEDKDKGIYDNENDGDYVKSEYVDNSFNIPSKSKGTEVKNSIAAGSNPMANNYDGNIPQSSISRISEEIAMIAPFPEQEDSHFFFYFLTIVLVIMAGYLLFHNKQKIIALIVEGRHERRRRSHGAGYKKLETK